MLSTTPIQLRHLLQMVEILTFTMNIMVMALAMQMNLNITRITILGVSKALIE